ncbi:MAG: hypothetical protein ABI727_03345 [Nitrosospira sp.]
MSKSKTCAWLWAVVVCLLLAHNAYLWLGKRIVPDTDILALLPVQERDPVLQKSFTHMVDAAQQRIVVLIGAANWTDARSAADAYSRMLETRTDLLEVTPVSDERHNDWFSLFQQHRLTLLTSKQETQLSEEPTSFWLESSLSRLYSPFGGPKLGAWQDDPFGLFSGWAQERAQETPVRPRDGYLFVADAQNQYVLLPLMLKVPAFSITAQRAVLPLLEQAHVAARAAVPDVELISAGVILHAASASTQASGEVSTIGIGSLVGIVLLMWLTFHSFKPVSLILLSIGIGCLGAFSICWLLFEPVHLLTLVFGASLIGVAQDYGIYFMCNRLDANTKLDSPALLRKLLPSLCLTLLAAVIGYMGIALTPFPGLRQMAVFSSLGLIFAWLTVVFWFPFLIGPGTLKSGRLARHYSSALARWPLLRMNKTSLGIAVIFGFFALLGIVRLDANDDIRLLQSSPKQLISDQIKLSKLLDAPTPVQFYLVRGSSPEAVLQREETLKQRLDTLIVQQHISAYQAISNWVPSMRTQTTRLTLLDKKILSDGGPLSDLAQQIGEGPEWAANTKALLLAAAAPLAVNDFLRSPASEPWRHLWLGQIEGGYASIVALRGLNYAGLPLVSHAATGLEGVQWVDKVSEISSVLGRYRQYMGWVLIGAYLMIFGLLYPRYRHNTWRVLAPPALASIGTLALLGYAGQNLQLFHVLPMMLLLGIGADYGIFMQEHRDHHNHARWLTVGLSAASTILSFGLLSLSQTPALQAFGLTMLIGITLVWIIIPCFRLIQRSHVPTKKATNIRDSDQRYWYGETTRGRSSASMISSSKRAVIPKILRRDI